MAEDEPPCMEEALQHFYRPNPTHGERNGC